MQRFQNSALDHEKSHESSRFDVSKSPAASKPSPGAGQSTEFWKNGQSVELQGILEKTEQNLMNQMQQVLIELSEFRLKLQEKSVF